MVSDKSKLEDVEENWIPLALGGFGYLRSIPAEEVQQVGNKLKDIYSDGNALTMDSINNLFSDLIFNRAARLTTELHSYFGSIVYSYILTHDGGHSLVLATGQKRNGESRTNFYVLDLT